MKKNIQIFYGGFKFVKGGVNIHSNLLEKELRKKFNVTLISLDSVLFPFRYLPHLTEKLINLFSLPLGFYYKGIVTKFLFKFFFNKNSDIRIFEDIYISWNSQIPSVTMLHAVWSDNLQKYFIQPKIINKLKEKELNKINSIKHPIAVVSEPYLNYIHRRHYQNKIKQKLEIVELGVAKIPMKSKPKKKSIIYVGALEARKNIFLMLKIFKNVHEIDNKYRLTIIGTGPDKKKALNFCNKYRLPARFMGNRKTNEIFKELKKHQFYLHTSSKESFSLSLLEAKMCGLTTIAYKKLEVPRHFIDVGINDFKVNSWSKKILTLNKTKLFIKKFNYKKYLISNTAKKLVSLAK